MRTLVVMVLIGQTPIGPLEAFRANRADIRADVEFVQETGKVDPGSLKGRIDLAAERGFIPNPMWKVAGRWECDGAIEHFVYGNPPEIAQQWTKQKQNQQAGGLTSERRMVEVLFDGETAAWHNVDSEDGRLNVLITQQAPKIGHGPFYWAGLAPFPDYLLTDFAGVKPDVLTVDRDDRPLEVEVYKNNNPERLYQAEVHYDPSVGYLPRFIRLLGVHQDGSGRSLGVVKELHLIDAQACSAGGFVPTEWVHASYQVHNFSDKHPSYNVGMKLEPSSTVGISHYRVTDFKDRTDPPVLDHLDTITSISARGQIIELSGRPKSLTLDQVKALVGSKLLSLSEPILPKIDAEELHDHKHAGEHVSWPYFVGIAGFFAAGTWVIFRRGRGRGIHAALWIVVSPCLVGCDAAVPPVVRLTTEMRPDRLIYDCRIQHLPLTLAVKNEGTIPIKVFDVDGGCACRKVDKSRLPAVIAPREEFLVPIQFQSTAMHQPQKYSFQIETDHGVLGPPVTLQAVPDHYLTPGSITLNGLVEDEEGDFELTHRSIYRTGESPPSVDLVIPPKAAKEEVRSHSGRVAGSPEYTFTDTTYRIIMNDREIGLHAAAIILQNQDGDRLAEVPITWKRVPFLSSMPDRVVLGKRPVRVFLRCPDTTIELTEILNSPAGTHATIRSPHEILVALDEEASGTINGMIEVATTADKFPPLRIPVVRYAPKTPPSGPKTATR